MPSGSRARRSRTRCCRGRSSAPRARRARTSRPSCWGCGSARRSILTSRQHLLNEAEHPLCELPLELREQLPDSKAVRPRLAALAGRDRRQAWDAASALRLRLLDDYRQRRITALDADERAACRTPRS
jgi:hypothetical protein